MSFAAIEKTIDAAWEARDGVTLQTRGEIRDAVEAALDSGQSIIADIEVLGAERARAAYPENVVAIFIQTPSIGTLMSRMRERRETEAEKVDGVGCHPARKEIIAPRLPGGVVLQYRLPALGNLLVNFQQDIFNVAGLPGGGIFFKFQRDAGFFRKPP